MTLREQIKAIHAKHFSKEFTEYREDVIPAMVNDLKLKMFDDLALGPKEWLDGYLIQYWALPDSVDIRAIKRASELIQSTGLREDTPAVE